MNSPTASNAALDPLAPLWEEYHHRPRSHAFHAGDSDSWLEWKEGLAAEVPRCLGRLPVDRGPVESRTLERKEFPGYVRERVVFRSREGADVPAYLLLPTGARAPAPAVLALHGHGYGKDDLVGIRRDGTDRDEPEGYHKDFGLALVRRGFAVLAPEQAGFGERRLAVDKERGADNSSCRQLFFTALMLGQTALGIRVWDAFRSLDYLATRPEVDASRLGCMGISGGGMTGLFATALDPRVGCAVISGYLNTFKDSILGVDHCPCNYAPGLLQVAEMYDVAALIAPRPLLVESGTDDKIFPIAATRYALEQVAKAYQLLRVPERLESDLFEGGHQISGAKAYDWLARWLGPV